MILGVDLSSNQANFNFTLATAQGCRLAYIKLGGENIPEYVSGSYAGRVDAAHAAGWPTGSYWITGGHTPDEAANFFASHLRNFRLGDFIVLDNETLDDGNTYNDAEAAAWMRKAIALSGVDPAHALHYANKSFMESQQWPQLLATGCSFLIADYNGTPLVNHVPRTIPAARVVGHQYADNGNIGGAHPVDLNAFTDSFLAHLTQGDDMPTIAELQPLFDAQTQAILSGIRREGRGRLFYCPNPPTGLPQFVVIFENRDPGSHNVLYCNDGEVQAEHLMSLYGQTADTVAQAKAAPDTQAQFATRLALALGTDSAFTDNLATLHTSIEAVGTPTA